MTKRERAPKPVIQPTGLIDPRYCCCAVPLVNVGLYSICLEQFVISIVIGGLAIGAPEVVGTSYASFASYIFAVTCFLIALCQPIGWIGALREKTSTFKVYKFLNLAASVAAFIVSGVLIIVSAAKHSTAVSECKSDYYSTKANSTSSAITSSSNATLSTEGSAICPPIVWADVGIMGALWLILLVCQTYFIYLTFLYSKSQVKDHKLYHSVYSENPEAFTMSILRSSRYNPGSVYNNLPSPPMHDAWDSRPSTESMRAAQAGMARGSGYYDDGNAHGIHPAEAQFTDDKHRQEYRSSQYADSPDFSSPPVSPHAGYPASPGRSSENYSHNNYGHSHQYSLGGGETAPMAFPQATAYSDQKHPSGPR